MKHLIPPAADRFEAFKKDAIAKLKAGKGLTGAEGAFTPLIKSFLEEALGGEIDAHIAEETEPNRKNGKGKKTVRISHGKVEIGNKKEDIFFDNAANSFV